MADLSTDTAADVLARCVLFRTLDTTTRRRLASHARRQRYSAGQIIFNIGSAGHSLMAVVVGTVRIKFPTASGKEIVLADLGAGEIFGEFALLDGKERSADALALTNCELLILDRRDFLPFLEQNPQACLRVMEMLCGKLRGADERMAEIAFLDLPTRLAKTLLRRAGQPRRSPAGSSVAKLSLSQSELASMIGGRRESVNRCLREWERQGILNLVGGRIAILDPEALARVAEHA